MEKVSRRLDQAVGVAPNSATWLSDDVAGSSRFFQYRMYGLGVESQIPLPIAPVDSLVVQQADWTIKLGASCDEAVEPPGRLVAGLQCFAPCHNGRWVTRVYRGLGGTWFWYDAIGTFHVAPDGRSVRVFPAQNAEMRALGIVLMGPIATFVLHKLGYASLHASAVVVDGGAIVFIGPAGHGKSTMAAYFLRRGAGLLSDDVLALDVIDRVVHGVPSLPLMKLWDETAEHSLQLPDELPNLTDSVTKKLFLLDQQWEFATSPVPIRAVYVLDRYDPKLECCADCTITPLRGQLGLAALLAQTSNRAFIKPHENAILLPVYARLLDQTPVRVLHYPHGFVHQHAVHTALMHDEGFI